MSNEMFSVNICDDINGVVDFLKKETFENIFSDYETRRVNSTKQPFALTNGVKEYVRAFLTDDSFKKSNFFINGKRQSGVTTILEVLALYYVSREKKKVLFLTKNSCLTKETNWHLNNVTNLYVDSHIGLNRLHGFEFDVVIIDDYKFASDIVKIVDDCVYLHRAKRFIFGSNDC